jgi:hypothetical protein
VLEVRDLLCFALFSSVFRVKPTHSIHDSCSMHTLSPYYIDFQWVVCVSLWAVWACVGMCVEMKGPGWGVCGGGGGLQGREFSH